MGTDGERGRPLHTAFADKGSSEKPAPRAVTRGPHSDASGRASLPFPFAQTFAKPDFVKKNLKRHEKVSQSIATYKRWELVTKRRYS